MTTPVACPPRVAAPPLKGATPATRPELVEGRFRGVRWKQTALRGWPRAGGFTLIELMVVMAIVAVLLTIVTPSYFAHLERSREAALRETLAVTRDAIDKFHGDHERYPNSLQELVDKRYLRRVPVDPITESSDSWNLVTPPGGATEVEGAGSGVWDLRSGAQEEGKDYDQW